MLTAGFSRTRSGFNPSGKKPRTFRNSVVGLTLASGTAGYILIQPASTQQFDIANLATPTENLQIATEFETVSRADTSIPSVEELVVDPTIEETLVTPEPQPEIEPDIAEVPDDKTVSRMSSLAFTSAQEVTGALYEGDTQNRLEALVIEALRQGQSEDYIDALVNHEVKKGTVDVPGALVTHDGRVDTATLLSVIVETPEDIRATTQNYTVQAGDSLSSISYLFFGTTARASEIYSLNQDLLVESGGITVGQNISIPPG